MENLFEPHPLPSGVAAPSHGAFAERHKMPPYNCLLYPWLHSQSYRSCRYGGEGGHSKSRGAARHAPARGHAPSRLRFAPVTP